MLRFLLFVVVLFISTPVFADGSYECANESIVWANLYNTVLRGSDPLDRGRAVRELNKWNCEPVDIDGDGRLEPNPRCTPPPNCGLTSPVTQRPINRTNPITGRVIIYQPPEFQESPVTLITSAENRIGGCSCVQLTQMEGEQNTCTADINITPRWGFDQLVQLGSADTFSGQSVVFTPVRSGRMAVFYAPDRICAHIQTLPKPEPEPTLLEQAIANSAEVELVRANKESIWKNPVFTAAWVGTVTAVLGYLINKSNGNNEVVRQSY